jgi:hypothetical protein
MALAYRAPKVSSFDIRTKGKSPAPGTYNPDQRQRPRSVPYVGFSSTGQRSQLALANSANEPGPGEHQLLLHSKEPGLYDTGSNSFKSNSSRFAPFAPGSTVFRPSSVLDNPGPAAYSVRKDLPGQTYGHTNHHPTPDHYTVHHPDDRGLHLNQPMSSTSSTTTKQQPRSNSKSALLKQQQQEHNRYTPVPTIPVRRQSHGYDQSTTGKLLPQPAPVKEYAGIGMDTVGPAAYDVRQDPTKSGAPRVNFAKSSKRMALFGSGNAATKLIGPGSHNIAGARFVDRTMNGTAAFNSKTPMAHERDSVNEGGSKVGPGAYTLPSTIKGGLEDRVHLTEGLATHVQRFGSTEERNGGWDRDLRAPYTNKKNTDEPGPGAYGEKRTSFRTKIQKKLTNEIVGFNSTDPRPCLKQKKTTDPNNSTENGVEFYSDPNAMAVAVHRKTVGRNGIFGSTEQRFNRGIFASPKNVQPGPGQYSVDAVHLQDLFPSERVVATAAFRSGVRRFGGHSLGSRKAMLELQHEQEVASKQHGQPAQHRRNNMSSWGTFQNKAKKKYPQSKYADGAKRGGGFTSTSGRFGTKGERAGLFGADSGGPGPGGYSLSAGRKSISNVRRRQQTTGRNAGTLGGSSRFHRRRARSSASLGPGHGSMMKKTFNITYSMK